MHIQYTVIISVLKIEQLVGPRCSDKRHYTVGDGGQKLKVNKYLIHLTDVRKMYTVSIFYILFWKLGLLKVTILIMCFEVLLLSFFYYLIISKGRNVKSIKYAHVIF